MHQRDVMMHIALETVSFRRYHEFGSGMVGTR
jgi:hypothetical protein